jgi:nucleotide-binding universal stress UspA family protein
VDGSDASLHVVPSAAAFARLFGSEVDVLRVEEPPLPSIGVRLPTLSRAALVPGPEATADAEKAVRRFEAYGVRARPLTAVGDPGALILETAEADRHDLIAMASHGRSGVSRWALGSVTERILRHATLPMLVVRARA